MSFPRRLHSQQRSRKGQSARPVPRRSTLSVEPLEERTLLDTGLGQLLSPTPSERYVTGLYYDLLHRQPQQSEVLAWASSIDAEAPREAVALGFIDSAENEGALIQGDYQTFLGRAPEPGAVQGWLNQMKVGLGAQQLQISFLTAAEYFRRNGGTNQGWLIGVYRDLFGRAPDQQGLASWNVRFQQGFTLKSIAAAFVASPENNALQISAVYQELLGRQADSSGMQFWLSAMQHGMTIETLTSMIAGSSEYASQQAGVVLPVFTGNDSGGSATAAGVQINLQAPAFTTSTTPVVTVTVSPSTFVGPVRIDVAPESDTNFSDPADLNQTIGVLTPQQNTVTLNRLSQGSYNVRARVESGSGAQVVSATVTMVISPNSGMVGSKLLMNLYHDYMQAMTSAFNNGFGSTPPTSFFTAHSDLLYFDGQQRVEVNVHATMPQFLADLEAELQQAGMTITNVTPSQDMVTGFLPITEIASLPSLPDFDSVTPVYALAKSEGSVSTQGDAVIGADVFRQTTSLDGAGIKVGVLSDTVSQVGTGIAGSQDTGDLPASGVQVLEEGPPQGATDEGRAMLEIVHDVAPGAALAFHTASVSPQDFASGIQDLASAGANVIVDDVGYLDSPFFNDGVIAQAAANVVKQGVFYVSAAGNTADHGYLASWNSTTATVGGVSGTFDDLGNGNPLQAFTLQPNQKLALDFQWDNAFLEGGSSLPNYQVQTEVDVLITTGDGRQILQEFNDNTLNTNEAVQIGSFVNDGSFGTNNFAMAFVLKQGPAPTMVRWISFADDPQALNEGAPTIFGQSDAPGVVAVGATPWQNPTGPEPFSSRGGSIPILFDDQGNRLATPDVRLQPLVLAPDGVDTSFFGQPASSFDPDQNPKFFGTSAAAPHVAAAAALVLSGDPSATPAQLIQHFIDTATPLPAPGFDPAVGFGLIQVTPLSGGDGGGGTGGGSGGTGTGTGGDLGQIGPLDTGAAIVLANTEPNDTSNQATALGLVNSGTEVFGGLSITNHANGLPDYDWYRTAPAQNGTLTVTVQYSIAGADLGLRLFAMDSHNNLIELGSSRATATTFQTIAVPVVQGETLFVWVYGFNRAQGDYALGLGLQ